MTDIGPHAEIRQLAYDMIRLEAEIERHRKWGEWIEVGELTLQREEVQYRRSVLMLEVWKPRRRRKTHAAA